MTAPEGAGLPMEAQAEATERARHALERLEWLDGEQLSRYALSLADIDRRGPARGVALQVADSAGLGPMITEARASARQIVERAMTDGAFMPTWAGVAWGRGRARLPDRVALVAAAQDGVLGAVVETLVPDDVVSTLQGPMSLLDIDAWSVASSGAASESGHRPGTGWAARVVFIGAVLGSLLLIAVGSSAGLAGLAMTVGAVLVWFVWHGRISL